MTSAAQSGRGAPLSIKSRRSPPAARYGLVKAGDQRDARPKPDSWRDSRTDAAFGSERTAPPAAE